MSYMLLSLLPSSMNFIPFYWPKKNDNSKLPSARSETTMESLRPRNVARIPWSEVERQRVGIFKNKPRDVQHE